VNKIRLQMAAAPSVIIGVAMALMCEVCQPWGVVSWRGVLNGACALQLAGIESPFIKLGTQDGPQA